MNRKKEGEILEPIKPEAGKATGADSEEADIRDTDILFECPDCGKSMVIDYRGAGLTIPCTDCGQPVDVPIPQGMDVSDLDTSEADQGVRVIQMRELLADAQRQILVQESMIERLKNDLEKARHEASESGKRFQDIRWETEVIQRAVEKVHQMINQ